MLFRKKYDRGMEAMREKNRDYLDSMKEQNIEDNAGDTTLDISEEIAQAEKKAREFHEEDKLELEKGDLPAIIISALLTFGPIILVLGGILAVAWIFLH